MNKLEDLLELYKQQITIKKTISKTKREINKELRKENKLLFRLGDILVISMILFNIAALILTNALVVKQDPGKILTEVNPVTAEAYDYVPTTDIAPVSLVYGFIVGFFLHIIGYTILITYWMYNRFYLIERKKVYHTLVLLTLWSMLILTDFFNNLGFYIGKVIWGG